MTRYRLPDILGSVECAFHSLGHEDGDWIVELVDTAPGLRLELPASSLTEVNPPLPPEPPIGSVVLDSSRKAWQRTGGHRGIWECCQDDAGADWEDLNAAPYTPVTLLVPAPEPVALPFEFRVDDRTGDPTGTAAAMFVKIDPDCFRRVRFGFYNTISRTATPAQAREIGHAYLSAADAVEAQS